MASHVLSCPILTAFLPCYTAEPLGLRHVLQQGSGPQMVGFVSVSSNTQH